MSSTTGLPRLSAVGRRLQDGPKSWAVHRLAMRRLQAGDDIVVLTIGQPDFATEPHVVEAAVDSLRAGRTRYGPSLGDAGVREAIARHVAGQVGRDVDPRRVVFFPGAQAALFGVLRCLVGPGNAIVVPEPRYATYLGLVDATGARRVDTPLLPDRGFHPDLGDIQAKLDAGARAVLVTTPHNPAGSVLRRPEIEQLAEMCRDRGAWLVSDEVYAPFTYGGVEHTSVLEVSDPADAVVSIGSLSKSHAMTGFRHGWAVVPEPLVPVLEALIEAMLFGSPPFIQDAGVVALERGAHYTEHMRRAYERRAHRLVDSLMDVPGLAPRMPEGGMFVFLDIRATGMSDEEFAYALLEHASVAVTPTSSFGPSAEGHVRVSLGVADDRLDAAVERIRAWLGG